MLRVIFIQLWNQKRINISVVAELLCVFGLAWYIVDYLFVYAYTCNLPSYRDLSHAWVVGVDLLPEDNPEFRAAENEPQALYDNFLRLVNILSDYPDIEAVGVSSSGSLPATGTYHGQGYYLDDDTINEVGGQIMSLDPKTDYFRVFRHTCNGGKTPVSTQEFDWLQPGIVISRSVEQTLMKNGGSAVGHTLTNGDKKGGGKFKVVGVIDDVKRFDYQRPQNVFYAPMNLTPERDIMTWKYGTSISIRSRATVSKRLFKETFNREMSDRLRIGNFYLKSLTSYDLISDNTAKNFGITTTVRMNVALMLFLLLNIVLCVFGTFWYRIHTRRGEIGLRKAMGATTNSIRNHFFIEGLLLLTVAAAIAILIEIQIVTAYLLDTLGRTDDYPCLPDRTWLRFMITNGITYIILTVVILISILIPARRAAALQPSEALRDE
ncbi:MAG: FtsX-like permease family protein [Tannerella sp.]|jgi:hypothetical protein|nr:FtsX-like permease family protein [Tannerella sp.]